MRSRGGNGERIDDRLAAELHRVGSPHDACAGKPDPGLGVPVGERGIAQIHLRRQVDIAQPCVLAMEQ